MFFIVENFVSTAYTMCIDKSPIRNTLYGYIVSPGYPHPMADNLKCSINIGTNLLILIDYRIDLSSCLFQKQILQCILNYLRSKFNYKKRWNVAPNI